MCDRCLLLNTECSLATLLRSMHHGRMSLKICDKKETSQCATQNTVHSRKLLNDRFSDRFGDKQKLMTENNSAVMM